MLLVARMEARRLGDGTIEPEHLLLALLQDTSQPVAALLSGLTRDEVRAALSQRVATPQTASPSSELALSEGATRALAFAVEEADRLEHIHVGPEHILIGLLRQDGTAAAALLTARGLEVNAVRRQVAEAPGFPGPMVLFAAAGRATEGPPRDQLDRLTALLRVIATQARGLSSTLAIDPDAGARASALLQGLQALVDAIDTGSDLDLDAARQRLAAQPRRPYDEVRPRRILLGAGTSRGTAPSARLDQFRMILRLMAEHADALAQSTADAGENAEAFRLGKGLRALDLAR